jgi:hypothetical protein
MFFIDARLFLAWRIVIAPSFEFLGSPAPAKRALTEIPEKDILPMVKEPLV